MPSPRWQELKEGFDYTFNVLGSGRYLKPAASTQNPHNDFYQFKPYRADAELRPDVYLSYRRLELMAKPRASYTWEKSDDDDAQEETVWRDETWVSEYLIRYGIHDHLFLSYGRENLQWGPTLLYSPSNPFFLKTGRANSQTELSGKGFARLVYVPDMVWTITLIANLDEGPYASNRGEFDEIYAFKLDCNGAGGYASVILSHQPHGRDGAGMFGAWTLFDNTLLYIEGELSDENDVLYPLSIDRHPMGGELTPLKQGDSTCDGTLIVGGSFTLETSTRLSLEYLYNSRGYSDREAEAYYALLGNAANAYDRAPYSGLVRQTLGRAAVNGLQYLRQNYLFAQISQSNIGDVLGLTFILTYNMDDHSSMSILNVDYSVNDHIDLYVNGIHYHGRTDSEFSSRYAYTVTAGFQYSF